MATTIHELNDDCLIHIFNFLGPKEWITFSKVCTRWNYITDFCWENNFEVYTIRKSEELPDKYQKLFDIKITFSEINEILKRIAPTLEEVTLLWINIHPLLICCFGTHYYEVTESFNLTQLLQILSDESYDISSLETFCLEPEDELLWKKIIENNSNLTSFILHNVGSSVHDDSCLDSDAKIVCNHDDFIKDMLLSLPNTLNNLFLNFWQYPFPKSWHEILEKQSHLKIQIKNAQCREKLLTSSREHLYALYLESCSSSQTFSKISQKLYLDIIRSEILLMFKNFRKVMFSTVQTLLTLE